MKSSRRQFMIYSVAGAATMALANQASAQAMVAESDPQANALGYKADASTVDKAKFAKYADGQKCSSCALYASKSAEAGACGIFAGKQVAAKGWCNAYAKKG